MVHDFNPTVFEITEVLCWTNIFILDKPRFQVLLTSIPSYAHSFQKYQPYKTLIIGVYTAILVYDV